MKIALCLITWNEIDGCKQDIPHLNRSEFDEIFCIDGGSTDGTVEFLAEQNISVFRQVNPGLNQACKEGVERCTSDAIVFFHPKGTVPVEDCYRFKEFFYQGYQFIVASRMMKKSRNEEDSHFLKPRKWFVLGLSLFAKILFKREGNTIWDSLHGFRGITTEAFKSMDISDRSPSIDIEMVCRSYKKKISRVEFPTSEYPRKYGKTHFKSLPTGKKLLKYIWWEIGRD